MCDVGQRRAVSIMLMMTMRPLEPSATASTMRARLLREPICELLELSGLDFASTAELIRSAGVHNPSSQLIAAVYEKTDGNPLFIESLVAELLRRGGIEYVSGDAVVRDVESSRLSTDITAAATARVAMLNAEPRSLLEYAALLGQRFALETLAEVTRADVEEVDLSDVINAGDILTPDGDEFEFVHPLLRQVLCEGIPRKRRRSMHNQIAEAWMAKEDDTRSLDATSDWQIVHHLIAAGPEAEREKLLEFGRRAGDRSAALYGWREAAEAYVAAATASEDRGERASLYHSAAWCFTKNYDYGLCAENYAHALDDYRALGDEKGVARVVADSARTALYHLPLGEMRELESFEECLRELDEDESVLRGNLLARMADAYFYARRTDRGLSCAREALVYAERSGDSDLREDALLSSGLAQHQGLDFRGAEASFRAALSAPDGSDHLHWENPMRIRYASVLHVLGQLDEAQAELDRSLVSTRRMNDPGEEALCAAHLTVAAVSRGRFGEAEQAFATVIRLRPRLERRPWAPIIGIPALAYGRYLQGLATEADEALAALEEPGRILTQVGRPVRALSAIFRTLIQSTSNIHEVDDDGGSLRARTVRYCERMSPGHADGSALGIVGVLVELADVHGLPLALEGPVAVLKRAFNQGALVCGNWPSLVPRLLGVAAFALGRHDEAVEYFEVALVEAERLGMRPELGRIQLDLARLLIAMGSEAREIRARGLLEEAAAIFEDLGMTPFYDRAARLAEALGMRLSIPTVTRRALRARDLDLLRRVSAGHTNSRVADELLLSRDTVQLRLASLYELLGVSGRLEAAANSVERGMHQAPDPSLAVALLVTDLQDFSPMVERLGDAKAQLLIQQHNFMIRARIRDFGGVEITHTGDGVIVSFRSVVEAVSCAIEIQRQFSDYNERTSIEDMHVRIGVHSGTALPEEGRLFGTAVNTAVRICGKCEPDHILTSERVYTRSGRIQTHFKPQGMVRLKGITRELMLYEVAWS
jgi:class 3 adenylate cyclase